MEIRHSLKKKSYQIKNQIPRKTRLSITFRNVVLEKVKYQNIILPISK